MEDQNTKALDINELICVEKNVSYIYEPWGAVCYNLQVTYPDTEKTP